ncbi:protein lava lamp [Diachasma alloeum]|uniref:protein lava lamp n=1 Tax=Diachasma alloeum TaxID=454923 RepID=UPI0007384F5F|nr:protein lava lamp [Diachasma alloeum]
MSGGAEEPPGLSEDTASDAIGASNLQEQDKSELVSYKDIMMKNKVDLKKKEEEVQEYVNKLSKIKSRTKLSRRSTDPSTSLESSKLDSSLPKLEDEDEVNDISEAKTPKAKSHLLQKKLAENRKIFEQRSKEITESNRAVEEKVEEIRKQINETELQKDIYIPVSITPISLLPQPSGKDPHQLQEKDNKIEELNMKIHELEAIIIDLQDNLKEKDSVIDSKMKAVTLMSEDLSKKGKTTLDTLEETKDEMRTMQQNFVLMETSFKDKHEHLLEQLKEKSNRVIELEETLDKMENERKMAIDRTDQCPSSDEMVGEMKREMTAMQENFILIETGLKDKVNNLILQLGERDMRLAEVDGSSSNERTNDSIDEINRLEESNRVLREENEKLTKTVENVKIQNELNQEKDNRITELEGIVEELRKTPDESEAVQKLKKELEELNKNMIKLKAQHKSKLRNLNKRLENFKMVSDANAELVKLGNQVALLEEEKGNLQLSLVDFDELKAWSVELQTRIGELESKVEAQTGVIQAHVDAIATLENQKLDLMQELHNVKQEISALEAENADCENLRVTAELKVVELEDQLESLNRAKPQSTSTTSLHNDESNDNKQPAVDSFESIEENRNELLKQVDLLTQQNQNLEMQLREFRQRDPAVEKKSSDTDSTESFERISDNNDGSTKMDALIISEEKLSEPQEHLTDLHQKMEHLVQENNDLVIELTKLQEKVSHQTEDYKTRLTTLELQNSKLKQNLTNLCNETALMSLATEISNCKQATEQQLQLIENLEMTLLQSNQQLSEKREEITECQQLIKNLSSIQSKFTEMEEKIEHLNIEKSSIAEKFQLSSIEISELSQKSKELENTSIEKINNLQSQLSDQSSEILSLKEVITTNEKILEEVKHENNELKITIDSLQKEKSWMEDENTHLNNQLQLKEDSISALEGEFKTTVSIIEDRLKDKEVMLMSSESQIPILQNELEEKDKSIEEFEKKIEWLEALLQAKEVTLAEEKERMTAEFDSNVTSLEKVLENKTSLVASLQTEIQSLLETLKNNEVTIITLQGEINSLHSALAEREISAVSLAEETNACQESLMEKESLYQSCSSTLASDKSESEVANIEIQQKLIDLQSQVENSNSIIKKLKEEIENITSAKIGLEQEAEQIRLGKSSLEISTTALSYELELLKIEVNMKHQENDQLKVMIDELKTRSDSMDKELKEKYNELEHNKAEINDKESIIINMREEVTRLNEVIAEKENSCTALEAEIMGLQQQLREKATFTDKIEELTQIITEKEETINRLESVVTELNEKLCETSTRVNEFGQTLREKESILLTLLEEKESLIQQIAAETSAKEEALASIASLNRQLENQTSYIEEIRAELSDAYRMMEQLKLKHMEDIGMQNQRLEEIILELNDKTSQCSQLTSILEEKERIIGENVTLEIKTSLEQRIIQLEKELEDVNATSQAQLQKMKVIAANLKKKTAQCQELEAKAHDFEEKWTNEKSEKEEINIRLQQVQSDVEMKINKMKELEQQLIDSYEGTTNASETIQRLSDELNTANDTISSLHDRVKVLQLETERLSAEIDEKSKSIESEKLMRDSITAEFESYKQITESDLNSSNEKIMLLNEQIMEKKEEFKNLEETNTLNQRMTSETIELLKTQLSQLEETLNSMKDQIEFLAAEVENKSSEISSKDQQIGVLTLEIDDKNNQISSLTIDIDQKIQEIDSLTSEIESEKLSKDSITSELEALKTLKTTLEQELEEAKEKARELGVRMQVMETEYVDQLNTIQTLRTENGMLSSKHAQTHERLENTEAESTERLRVIESLKNEIIELKNAQPSSHPPDSCDHCERCQGLVNALEGKLQERNAEIQNLDNELANSIANFLQMRENLRTQEMQCNEESQEARKSLAQFNNLLARNSDNELRIQQLHEQIINLNDRNCALDEELIKTREIAALAQHFEQLHLNLSQIHQEKEKELEELNAKFQELQIEKDDLSEKLDNLKLERTTVEKLENIVPERIEQVPPAPKLFDAAKLFTAPAPWDVDSSIEDTSSLKKRLEDIEIEKSQLSSQLNQLTTEISSYQLEIRQLREKNEELAQLSSEAEGIKSIVRDFEQQVQLLSEENNQLRAELLQRQEFIARPVEDLRISQDSTDAMIETLKREKDDLQNTIVHFITNAKRLIEDGGNSEEFSINDYVTELTAIISTIRSLQQRIIDLNSTSVLQSQENKEEVSEEMRVEYSLGLSAPPLNDEEIKLDDEEEWGWNAQDAELGSGLALAPICTGETQLKARIAELGDTIKDLEDEKLKLTEEIKVGQIRSGKLVKKLKQFKAQNENLQKQLKLQKSSGSLCDLDSAIEDELKSQISQLEKNLSEVKSDHNKIIQERDNLLKRIDVLIAANERFTEMKERQDREVEVLQIRNKELASKIGGVERDIGEVSTSLETCETEKSTIEKVSKEQYDELQESLEMLATENEQLRTLIEAEKSERLAIEISLSERMREIEKSKNQTDEMKIGFDETLKKCQNLETECRTNLEIANQRRIEVENNHEIVLGQALQRSQELESEIAERNERIRLLEESLNASEHQLNDAQETLSNVTELLNVRVQEVAELRQQIQQLQGAKIEAATCRVNVDNLNKKLMETEEDMSRKLTEQEEDLSRKLTQREEDLTRKLTEREEDLTRQLTEAEEDLSRQLSHKEAEMKELSAKLQATLQEKTEEIDSLSSKIQELSSDRDTLRSTIENQNQELQLLKESLDKNEWLVEALKTESNVKKETVSTLENDLSSSREEIIRLTTSITTLTSEIDQRHQELSSKENEIESLKGIVTNLQAKLEERNCEICPKCKENEGILSEIELLKEQLRLKEAEVEDLKYILNESTYPRIFQELQDKVNSLYNEKTQLETSLSSALHQLHAQGVPTAQEAIVEDEASVRVIDLQKTLDVKEAEVESLKKKLESKTTECSLLENALAKEISSSSSSGEESQGMREQSLTSSELDVALYMLHQRDVRCEELTHELMQLLEERDTLQLRLSNAIRLNEEMRRGGAGEVTTLSEQPVNVDAEKIQEKSDPSREKTELAQKLSQLHTVGHRRDIRLMDDRELRNTQQMSLLAHKDALSTLPPDAAARLINANYTLSRDVQSQSSVLLNWLWGKSTPKRLSDELNTANDTISSLHDRVKVLQLETERLSAEIDEKSKSIESEKLMRDSITAEFESYKQITESDLNSSNEKIMLLNEQIMEKKEEFKNLEETNTLNQRMTSETIELLKTQLSQLEETLNSMKDQIEFLAAEVENKSSEISSKDQQIGVLTLEIDDKNNQISSLTIDIDQKIQEIDSLTSEIESEKLSKDSITSELEALKTLKTTLEQELEEAKEKARELGVRMQVMETEYVDQLNTIQTLRTENGMLSSKHAQTHERLENTEAESTERLRVIESLKNEIIELKNAQPSSHPPDSCDHCERCQGLVNALEGKLQERNAEIQNLDNELANSIANFLQMRENLRTQEMQCNEESQEARKSLAQFNNLLARNSDNELRIQQLHEQIINLNDRNCALDEELIKTREIAALAQHFEQLHLNLSQIHQEKEKELEELNAKFQELQIEKDDLSEKLDNLKLERTTVEKLENIVPERIEQVPPAPKLFDAAKLFTAPAPWDVDSSIEDTSSLKKRLEDIEIEKSQLSSQLNQLTTEISSYQLEIRQLREKNEELAQLSSEAEGIKSIVRDFEQQVQLLSEENNQLRAELLQRQEFIARPVEDLRISQDSTDAMIETLKREKDDLQNTIVHFITNAKRLIEDGGNSEEFSINDYVTELTAIISTIRSLQQRIIDLNSTSVLQSQENKEEVSEEMRVEYSLGLSAPPLNDEEIKLDDEEEWGWNAQDAELGSGLALAPICTGETQLKARIAELGDTIKDLEDEKLKLTEEIKVGQIRSGKLVKKLKQFKAQNENLQKQLKLQKSSGSLCDLDSAIEDELKSQISQLEKNLSEVKSDHNKIIQERDNLLKRIDVLIAANERFTEMKERQDREVEVLQIRNKELASKIGGVERDIGEVSTSLETCETEKSTIEKVSKEQYDELQESLEMLATENEQLRTLIEAEKSERLAIEISLSERMREIEKSKNQTDEMKIGFDETLKKCQNLETECRTNLEIANQRRIEVENNHEIVLGQALQRSQELESEIAERNERIRLLEESLNASEHQLNDAQETLSNVTELLNVRVQEVAELRQQIQQLQGAKIEAATCRVNVDNLNKKLMETEEDMSRKLTEQEEDLSRKLTQREEDLTRKLTEREEDLTRQLTEAEEDLSRQLSHKEAEMKELSAKLQATLQEKTEEIDSLSSKIQELSSDRDTLRSTIENQNQELQLLKESLDKNEWLVEALKTESNVKKETVSTLENDLSSSREEIIRLTTSITTLTSEIDQRHQELSSKENEIESLKGIVTNLQAKLEERNCEICPKCKENEGILSEIELLKEQLRLKEAEVEDLKYILNESTYPRIFQELQDKVNSLYNEKTQLETSLSSALHQLHAQGVPTAQEAIVEDEASVRVIDLQKTLDVKEAEVESLKKKLESKTTECSLLENALAKEISSSSSSGEESQGMREQSLTSSELDVALYMLHQRDVRCEELTHELMQLLEERDTLQLRLSNAIRLNEEMRRGGAGEVTTLSEQPVNVDAEKIQEKSDPSREKTELAQKLSQLHTVGHRRDIRLMDDRELRNTQQMSLLAHKDALSTLPPDAAARLINANYTLSRDVQSQSSVLLNWLWGKSTPKVVHM